MTQYSSEMWRARLTRSLMVGLAGLMSVGSAAAVGRAEDRTPSAGAQMESRETATFAGGCFWCMEPPFEKLTGVLSVTAGYAGGPEASPTYAQVSSGATGHAEAVQVVYDPSQITYERLLDAFWMNIDPTTTDQQFADHGRQYRTAIFCHSEAQRRSAEASKERLAASKKFAGPIVTEIVPATTFYPAEEYHQDYYKKHPLRYRLYRTGSGRAGYLRKIWGDEPS